MEKLEKYKPSFLETVSEMVRDFYENTSRSACAFFEMAGLLNFMPYVLPSVYRQFKEVEPHKDDVHDIPLSDSISACCGFFFGAGGLLLQIEAYTKAVEIGHPEYLLIPVATNIANGIYEKVRKK